MVEPTTLQAWGLVWKDPKGLGQILGGPLAISVINIVALYIFTRPTHGRADRKQNETLQSKSCENRNV